MYLSGPNMCAILEMRLMLGHMIFEPKLRSIPRNTNAYSQLLHLHAKTAFKLRNLDLLQWYKNVIKYKCEEQHENAACKAN